MRKGVKSRAKILSKSFPKISGFGSTFPKGGKGGLSIFE